MNKENNEKKNNLFDRVNDSIKDKRERSITGKVNSIPFGFPRFEEQLPGIEQGKFYIVTANAKVGKMICPL